RRSSRWRTTECRTPDRNTAKNSLLSAQPSTRKVVIMLVEDEKICRCYPLSQPEDEYSLTIRIQPDGSGRVHCDECGLPMSPVGMSRADYLGADKESR